LNTFINPGPPLSGAAGGSAPVPEPAPLALVGTGVLALLGYAWRRRR
jgi:hypothetical protein